MRTINFKLAFRQLLQNKAITGIKLLGLVLGLTLSILLIYYALFELSYDSFHKNAKHIYRLKSEYFEGKAITEVYSTTDPAWGPVLKDEFPEVKDFVRIFTFEREQVVNYNNVKFRETRVFTAEPSFFRIFDYSLVQGDTSNVLKRPYTMAISESISRKYFGNENAIGKLFKLSNGKKSNHFEVTGVFKDFPVNSNLQYDFIISWETIRSGFPQVETKWQLEMYYTYVLLDSKADPKKIERESPSVYNKHSNWKNVNKRLRLIPLRDIHLEAFQQWEVEAKGNVTATWIILILGCAILLIALINHVNIIISQSIERSKLIGLRQILGSKKTNIVSYFVLESIILYLVAFLLSILIIELFTPLLIMVSNSFSIKVLFYSQTFWLIAGIEIAFCIIISGLIPGVIFSKLNPLLLLKGNYKTSKKSTFIQNSFTVFQFLVSIILIIATSLVYRQMDYVSKKDLGINMNQVLALRTPVGEDFEDNKMKSFSDALMNNPEIADISVSSDIPGRDACNGLFAKRNLNNDDKQIFDIMKFDSHFFSLYGINIIVGQTFSDVSENNVGKIMLNEKAVSMLNYKPDEIVGKTIYLPEMNNAPVTVLGVFKNFNQLSLHETYSPLMIVHFNWVPTSFFSLKLKSKNYAQIIGKIEKEWTQFFPSSEYDYFFVDQFFNQQYKQDRIFNKVLIIFSLLSVFISCLGVFAMSLYQTAQRTKEIGIRRVNGASRLNILRLLNKSFTLWVVIAFIIACPLAYWGVSLWLQNFPYRTSIAWWVFLLSGVLVFIIATATVGLQAWRAASRNPVEALRYE